MIINSIDQETKFEARHLIISIGLSLLGQLKREIEKFQKTNVGFIGENKFDVNRITVASIDSLYSIITTKKFDPRKEKVMDLLENSTSLFLDEAHHSPAKTFKQIVQKSKGGHSILIKIGHFSSLLEKIKNFPIQIFWTGYPKGVINLT